MTKFKVGDKVRILNARAIAGGNLYFNNGDITEVVSLFNGSPELRRTINLIGGGDRLYVRKDEYSAIELVSEQLEETPVEASQSVIDLLANISRRLYEAEQTIKEQAYEINELYKAVADRG